MIWVGVGFMIVGAISMAVASKDAADGVDGAATFGAVSLLLLVAGAAMALLGAFA